MEQQSKKKINIGLAEVIGVAITITAALLMFWKTTDVRLSALELRMNMKEQSDAVINQKLDKLQDGINDVKISLQTKVDKK